MNRELGRVNGDVVDAVDAVFSLIPLAKAGVCVNCDRLFTMLPGQSVCPGCGSNAWHPVKAWLNHLGRRVAE